jgi:ankyrin repeat protein
MNSRKVVKRIFIIEYKVENFNEVDDIDLLILGIAKIKDDDGRTALIWASYCNNLEVVQALIQAGTDVNIKNNNGRTALMYTSDQNHLEVAQVLIEAGANVNIRDNEGNTALIWASYRNHLEVIKALIQAGTDVNIKNNYGKTALNLIDNMKIKDLLKQAGIK